MKRIILVLLTAIFLMSSITVFADEVSAESIKISVNSTTMKVGETQKIIISVTPSEAAPELEYESDNPDVVTAAIGTLIANSEGVANIIVKVSGTDIKDSIQITVSNENQDGEENRNENSDNKENESPSEENVKVKKITVENKTIYLKRYETERIVYSVNPENATDKNVSFRSSNTSVATVDDRGYVYAKKNGNSTITIKSDDGSVTATVKVYVSDDEEDDGKSSTLRSVYITHEDEIVKDKFEVMESSTIQFGIKASPNSASKKVTWRSSNKKIATVDSNGRVTGVKKGTCTIYATSTVNSSKRDSVIIVVTDYIRYPDSISIIPQENAIYETGSMVQFTAKVFPEDTTERKILWQASGGADISQTGLLRITDAGEITVRAYSSNYKTFREYKFNAVYGKNHFSDIGGAYNLLNKRKIEMNFDTELSSFSAVNNIFAARNENGNGEHIKIIINTDGKKVTISPAEIWPEGDVYVFIKSSLCDKYGNSLGKNLKCKLNIRGNVYVK